MEKVRITLVLSLLSAICLAQSPDEKAIKKALADETNAFIKLDLPRQMSFYVHEPYINSQYNNADGSLSVSEGWNAIESGMKAYHKANPKQNFVKVQQANWKLKQMGPDWYWVHYDQTMTDAKGKAGKSKETRIMQRINGQWKIASMVALWDTKK